ncbi:MAG: tRNA preQ1(34) S-adenosylmethionine ribosyltransferase-isomerase QueA [Syntrophobacteraceae bacterium]
MEDSSEISYNLDDYNYDLPDELIAPAPASRRDGSRLLVLDRSRGEFEHRRFYEITDYLAPGDVLVVNNTRVVPARLFGTKESGGRAELLVLDPYKDPELGATDGYQCIIKTSKRPRAGGLIDFQNGARARIVAYLGDGKGVIQFQSEEPILSLLDRIGQVPLPPYIHRDGDAAPVDDRNSYQTVYASIPGAVAAPTAGLHFSQLILDALKSRGIDIVTVTLHVGYGTFAPLRVKDIRKHVMHPEYAEVSGEAAEQINSAEREGRRIVAVGTTVVRILEWASLQFGRITEFSGFCNHYIYPGYNFRIVDALITNFHLPKSTLLLLVSAFAGRDVVLNAYREAVQREYRFFSYGDAMFIS